MKTLAKRGVRGFRLYADRVKANAWATSDGIRAMWKCGADEGLAMCLLADPDALPAIAAMCNDYPKTPVVIDHFARIGMRGAVDQQQLDQLLALSKFPLTLVKTSAFYAFGKKKAPYVDLGPMIRQLRDAYGTQRLLWGTDCPYQVSSVDQQHSYTDSVALLRDKIDFLSKQERREILRDTARRIFFSG
ncbi:MAG: amidohydrolase [Planctomycetota bacterium]|nr:MAG: amidohydrolase [Planctomycetota bacterium]